MKSRTYYLINSNINPGTIYGSEEVCCLPASEIIRLSGEFEDNALYTQFHTATKEEIEEYGTYDDGQNDIWYAVMMDREDTDWGYGSHFLPEAKEMAREYRNSHPDAYIAAIDESNSFAVDEITDLDATEEE